jgi:hypothetical protein
MRTELRRGESAEASGQEIAGVERYEVGLFEAGSQSRWSRKPNEARAAASLPFLFLPLFTKCVEQEFSEVR